MLQSSHLQVLSTLLREAGREAVLAADSLIDEPPAERPVLIAQAIARFGRNSDTVRVIARGCDIPGWLGEEVKQRSSAAPAPHAAP